MYINKSIVCKYIFVLILHLLKIEIKQNKIEFNGEVLLSAENRITTAFCI